jgi:putative drug exporter of the RND superfamily
MARVHVLASQVMRNPFLRWRWLVVALWLLGAGSFLVVGEGKYSLDFETPGDSGVAARLLEEGLPVGTRPDAVDLVAHAASGVDDPVIRGQVQALLDEAAELPHVQRVVSPYKPAPLPRVSSARTIALATIELDGNAYEVSDELVPRLLELRDEATTSALRVELSGSAVLDYETDVGGSAEVIGFAAALVILVLLFGSPIAAALPLLVAVVGLGTGMAVVSLLSNVIAIPGFAPQISAMIGIGVGVDYALLVVTRYRQALSDGAVPESAVRTAMRTSGRAVLLAGGTVVVALLGVVVVGQSDVTALAVAAAAVILVVVAAAVTLLPAVLMVVGHRIDWLSWRRRTGGDRPTATDRWVGMIQRRPGRWALASGLVLIALCVPALSMRIGTTDAGDGPVGTTSRAAHDLIATGFGPGRNTPIVVVADGAASQATVDRLEQLVAATPGVAAVAVLEETANDLTVLDVIATTAPRDAATEDLVRRIRSELPAVAAPASVHVGGDVAFTMDNAEQIGATLPVLFGAVVGCSVVLLLIGFRSLVVPLKAALMNVLSIGAAYGALVMVFQWGWGIGLLGLPGGAPIDSVLPVLMFAVTFGLSMDYEVFLLSRVREEWLRGKDNSHAVRIGVSQTAGVVTAAAAIMIAVFAAFMFGSERQVKAFGFAFAVPIGLDVLLIRLVLVPALMELMGPANWYLPRWLTRAFTAFSKIGVRR